jgi:hypothetical protein
MKEATESGKRKDTEKLLEEKEDAENEKLYKNQKVDQEDSFKPVKNSIN